VWYSDECVMIITYYKISDRIPKTLDILYYSTKYVYSEITTQDYPHTPYFVS